MDSPFGRVMQGETIPIMTVAIYLLAVFYMNRRNRGRSHKPWISTTGGWAGTMIVAYNSALSAFSAWIFLSSFRVLQRRWPSSNDPDYASRAVDILCNVDGGHSNGFQPSRDHPGRSNSIAYYTWLFYLSKYVELVDHVITLTKGKEVSFAHVFHHSGAILALWVAVRCAEVGRLGVASLAGMMANTAFHTVIYSYYAITSLRVRVPRVMKRTLIALQIAQFILTLVVTTGSFLTKYMAPMPAGLDYPPPGQFAFAAAEEVGRFHLPGQNGSGTGLMIPVPCLQTTTEAFTSFLGAVYVMALLLVI
ncbi:hypothetical protein ASPACDRAFT_80375 [Aspergillus aculeatus ATCC 16872]|uniref:Elongation of fatty acids protein n=1 Tax=Aspergillus aculeatus (strain ATCC 16872 / CBS 172.66 / WB 5094) TaxID=690307 RepID=A0A1L9WMY4_ASPA1|nr:uncharacterized protein ASPACDRAFT_80375 [Aspergillus aculeatus ATCC 16872]OJJ97480.1 hypothetical protein ASPACDRAFT_80375 [Aspergillus aculeatus ATCC 16872]